MTTTRPDCSSTEGQDVPAEPSVALVAVLLRADPIEVFHVVGDDEGRPVLPVLHAAHLLASGAREDANAVIKDAVHRLPVLVALKRRLGAWFVYLAIFQMAVVSEDEVVVL